MSGTARIEGELEDRLRRLNEIGIALSVERDLNTLLERIVQEARRFTRADAGTLFLVEGGQLNFEIAQNDTLHSFMGGSHGEAGVPPVPINRESVSGYVALSGETLNIADVYNEADFHFEGPRQYDRMTGYRTVSLLCVPMKDHEDQVIGVLQLLNPIEPHSGAVGAFSGEDQALIQSLASQAAVAINNVRLIEETERLFDAFVQVMATAIDERSPYTGGHILRVAEMTMVVAQAVNACEKGPLAGVRFSAEELEELHLAAWMHDIGKITTPEWVVDKPTKLHTLFDRIELLRTRFGFIRSSIELERTREKLRRLERGGELPPGFEASYARRLSEIDADIAFLERANLPGEFMEDADLERLRCIAAKRYTDGEEEKSYLTEDELENLSIRRGSLTGEERRRINDHAAMSIKMLGQIPFTRKLIRVPEIAGAHHEKLDGSGYPRGLEAENISLQARILALVDIFESLSADDRPYRARAMSREQVLRILRDEVESKHLDERIFDLFMEKELYLRLDEIKKQPAQPRDAAHG